MPEPASKSKWRKKFDGGDLIVATSALSTLVILATQPELHTARNLLIYGSAFVIISAAGMILVIGVRRRRTKAGRAFEELTGRLVASIEAALPSAEPTLEEEIAEVTASLSSTANRLRQLSRKADAFEAEVKDLVARGETARAMAALHESDAHRIGLYLGSDVEARLRADIQQLTSEHRNQIDNLRRSGNRTAVWTFVLGVLLGFVGNVVVALILG